MNVTNRVVRAHSGFNDYPWDRLTPTTIRFILFSLRGLRALRVQKKNLLHIPDQRHED